MKMNHSEFFGGKKGAHGEEISSRREQKQTAFFFFIQKGLSDFLPFLLEYTGGRSLTSVTT